MSTIKGFRVKVVGEYYARSSAVGKEKIIKNYKFKANIPSLYAALSTVKNKLLMPMLSKMYPDFLMYRTYHITQIDPLDEKSRQLMKKVEIAYMNRPSLVEFISEHRLPMNAELYPDLFKLRIAVQEAKSDPKAYLKKLELRKGDLEMDLEISKMNPGLHDSAGAEPSVSVSSGSILKDPVVDAPHSSKPEAKKDLSPKSLAKQTDNRIGGLRKDMIKTGEHGETLEDELEDI